MIKIEWGRNGQKPVVIVMKAGNTYQATIIKPELFGVTTSNWGLSNGTHEDVLIKINDLKKAKEGLVRVDYEPNGEGMGIDIIAAYFPRLPTDTTNTEDKPADNTTETSSGDTGGDSGDKSDKRKGRSSRA